jgi:hypothetical protein
MGETFFIILVFFGGIIFNAFWGFILGIGFGAVAFKNSIADTLLMLAKNIQNLYEIQQLKYIHYDMLDRDQKYVDFQKAIDEREMKSLKNTIIRNYINTIPTRYNHLIKFNDWDTAMLHLNKLLKERNNG